MQMLTVVYNSNDMTILTNHAVKFADEVEHHSYPLFSDTLCHSFDHFKVTQKHIKNAQNWS